MIDPARDAIVETAALFRANAELAGANADAVDRQAVEHAADAPLVAQYRLEELLYRREAYVWHLAGQALAGTLAQLDQLAADMLAAVAAQLGDMPADAPLAELLGRALGQSIVGPGVVAEIRSPTTGELADPHGHTGEP